MPRRIKPHVEPTEDYRRILPPYQRTSEHPENVGGLDTRSGKYGAPDPRGAMDLARAHLELSMPEESKLMRSFGPMDWLDRLNSQGLEGGVVAQANPHTGRVSYDFDRVSPDIMANDDVLAHELTHLRQGRDRTILGGLLEQLRQSRQPYLERADEQEAFEVERRRRSKRNDIVLEPES